MSPPAPSDVPRLGGVRAVGIAQPLRWLALGWADLVRCPLPGLLHGLVTAAFGALLLGLAGNRFWLLAGGFSGFLLVAPLLATGLYAVSRALEEGRPAGLATALAVWRPNNGRLMLFGVLLAFAGTGWVLTSASLITRFAEAPVHNPQDFLRVVVLSAHGHLFEGWLLLGSALAAPIFASTVVTVPLLMDRNIDRNTDRDTDRNAYRDTDRDMGVRAAVLLSVRAALLNPGPMALWATLILVITLLGMATLLVGMVVAVPWLAHASWHAYRDLVDLEGSR